MAKRLKLIQPNVDRYHDRLFGTGVAWGGTGDVQIVDDDKKADRLLSVPHLFEEVTPETEAVRPKGPVPARSEHMLDALTVMEMDGIPVRAEDATRAALARHADKEMGLHVKDGHSKADILTAIANAHRAIQQFQKRAVRDPSANSGSGVVGEVSDLHSPGDVQAAPKPNGAAPEGLMTIQEEMAAKAAVAAEQTEASDADAA